LCSTSRYGLNKSRIRDIEQCDADNEEASGVDAWLAERCVGDTVRVVYEPHEVFDAATRFFVDNWRALFCPSRDDVIIQSLDQDWVLYYCHEDEFEFGRLA
jgi:hypothetical protein